MFTMLTNRISQWMSGYAQIGVTVYDGPIASKGTHAVFQLFLADFRQISPESLAHDITAAINQECSQDQNKLFRLFFELVPSGDKYPFPGSETHVLYADCKNSLTAGFIISRGGPL